MHSRCGPGSRLHLQGKYVFVCNTFHQFLLISHHWVLLSLQFQYICYAWSTYTRTGSYIHHIYVFIIYVFSFTLNLVKLLLHFSNFAGLVNVQRGLCTVSAALYTYKFILVSYFQYYCFVPIQFTFNLVKLLLHFSSVLA